MRKTLADIFPAPPQLLVEHLKAASDSLCFQTTPMDEAKIFLTNSKLSLLYFKDNIIKMDLEEIDAVITADQKIDEYDELFISNFGKEAQAACEQDANIVYSNLCKKYKNNQ